MVSAALARNVIGIIGNVISLGFFLSPAPTFYGIIKKKVVEEELEFQLYHSVALSFVVWSCGLWVFYGMPFLHPHSILVVTNNSIGLVIHLIYFTIFCIYADQLLRKCVLLLFFIEAMVFAGVVLTTMLIIHSPHGRSSFIGFICAYNSMPHDSHFRIMWKVIKTKSVRHVSLRLSLTYFLNGVCWTTYALIQPWDQYVLIFNMTGAIFGFVLLMQYAYYRNGENRVQNVDVEAVELEHVPN